MDPKEKQTKSETYKVFDTKAPDAGRTHEIIVKTYPPSDGREPETRKFTLFSHKETEIPADIAMKFLVDPVFRVERANGERITPPPKYDPTTPLKVGEDETIANFDELQKSALFKRCKLIPGSEDITINAPNVQMIAFLKEHRRKLMHGNLTDRERDLLEKMQGGELAGLVEGGTLNKLFGERENELVTSVNKAADAQRATKAA